MNFPAILALNLTTSPKDERRGFAVTPGSVGRKTRKQVQGGGHARTRRREKVWLRDSSHGQARCHWCPAILTFATMTLDHVVALAEGGTNAMENLAIACGPCNRARGRETATRLSSQNAEISHDQNVK